MEDRHKQMLRLLQIMDILSNSRLGMSPKEIWDALRSRGTEVEPRTVYRDIEMMRTVGLPLVECGKSENGGQRWRFMGDSRSNHFLSITEQELWALHLLQTMTQHLEHTEVGTGLMAFFSKVEEKIGSKGRAMLQELSQTLASERIATVEASMNLDTLDTLRAACGEEQVVQVTYASANSRTVRERRLGPQFLYFAKNAFYLVAEDLEEGKTKVFAVARIQDAVMLDEPYTLPEGASPDAFFETSFGIFQGGDVESVELHFNAALTPFVCERRWHQSQTITKAADGSCNLRFEVAITPELVGWVLSWGENVKVIHGDTLRQHVQKTLERMVQLYADKRSA